MGEPNKSAKTLHAEAAECFRRVRDGEDVPSVAAALGLTERTVYRRLSMARQGALPSEVRRNLLSARLDHVHKRLNARLDDPEATHADATRLGIALTRTTATLATLHGVNLGRGEGLPPDLREDSGEWIDGDAEAEAAALDAEAELDARDLDDDLDDLDDLGERHDRHSLTPGPSVDL